MVPYNSSHQNFPHCWSQKYQQTSCKENLFLQTHFEGPGWWISLRIRTNWWAKHWVGCHPSCHYFVRSFLQGNMLEKKISWKNCWPFSDNDVRCFPKWASINKHHQFSSINLIFFWLKTCNWSILSLLKFSFMRSNSSSYWNWRIFLSQIAHDN